MLQERYERQSHAHSGRKVAQREAQNLSPLCVSPPTVFEISPIRLQQLGSCAATPEHPCLICREREGNCFWAEGTSLNTSLSSSQARLMLPVVFASVLLPFAGRGPEERSCQARRRRARSPLPAIPATLLWIFPTSAIPQPPRPAGQHDSSGAVLTSAVDMLSQ